MTKIKPFIDKCNWEGINSSSKIWLEKKGEKLSIGYSKCFVS